MEPQQNALEVSTQQSMESTKNAVRFGFKKKYFIAFSLGVAIVLVVGTFLYTKGFLVAATVNGSPISRLSVIAELEKQGGRQALESLISERLIDGELKKNAIAVAEADIDGEIAKIEEQVTSQGGTLEEALTAQGMSIDSLRTQIRTQKGLELLLADKVAVTDQELEIAIKSAEASAPEGMTADELRTAVAEQLQQQKFQDVAQKWVADLSANADITYLVNY